MLQFTSHAPYSGNPPVSIYLTRDHITAIHDGDDSVAGPNCRIMMLSGITCSVAGTALEALTAIHNYDATAGSL
jgi:hypothetical protein